MCIPGQMANVANEVTAVEVLEHKAKEEKVQRAYKMSHGFMVGYIPLSKHNLNTYLRSRIITSFNFLAGLEDQVRIYYV
jgi:hypothetical protein